MTDAPRHLEALGRGPVVGSRAVCDVTGHCGNLAGAAGERV